MSKTFPSSEEITLNILHKMCENGVNVKAISLCFMNTLLVCENIQYVYFHLYFLRMYGNDDLVHMQS